MLLLLLLPLYFFVWFLLLFFAAASTVFLHSLMLSLLWVFLLRFVKLIILRILLTLFHDLLIIGFISFIGFCADWLSAFAFLLLCLFCFTYIGIDILIGWRWDGRVEYGRNGLVDMIDTQLMGIVVVGILPWMILLLSILLNFSLPYFVDLLVVPNNRG